MTEQTKELVTKVDVQPDLAGLLAFEAEINRATAAVNQLDAAIKRVNELKPKTRFAPPVNNPGATAAAAGLAAGLGANLVNRGALGPLVRKASEDVAKNAAKTAATGVNLALENMQGHIGGGGGLLGFTGGVGAAGGPGALARADAFKQNPFNRFNFDNIDWRSPADLLTPDAAGRVKPAKTPKAPKEPGGGFKMPDMMVGAASAYALSAGLGAVADSMDRIQSSEAQLARLPQTIGSSKDAFIELTNAATQVRGNSDAFISTYTNMATATEKLGLSQAETIKSTQGLVSALQLGGGSKEAVSNALYQMGQAFSSNRFGGDEFRSFMEAIGTEAPEVAKAFGTDVAGLRQMSEQGKLTAETMVKAFSTMADKNMDLLKKQGWTWGQVTTVMGNDWDAFIATATENGEWKHLMGWIAENVTPVFRTAEQAVAGFWNSTTDESKASILIGILASIGAAFAALAIPVMAAVWPFLAVGAAVFLLYELFQEFKHWMDGSSKTIFDSLFGSFDEFEKRYPNIVSMFKTLSDKAAALVETLGQVKQDAQQSRNGMNDPMRKKMAEIDRLQANPMNAMPYVMQGLDWMLGLFGGNDKASPTTPGGLLAPSTANSNQTNISNSGNTTIQVATPEDAAKVANERDAAFVGQLGGYPGNMAEGGGYL